MRAYVSCSFVSARLCPWLLKRWAIGNWLTRNLCVMILCIQVLYIINARVHIMQNFVDRSSASTSLARAASPTEPDLVTSNDKPPYELAKRKRSAAPPRPAGWEHHMTRWRLNQADDARHAESFNLAFSRNALKFKGTVARVGECSILKNIPMITQDLSRLA